MAHWLLKTEPDSFSWDDQVQAGAKGETWSGVRAHPARRNLAQMQVGDEAFFYHTGDERRIVGIVRITRAAYPDPTAKAGEPWNAVTTVAGEALPQPVTLAAIKAEPALAQMTLVRSSRLSVQPVTAAEWQRICRMGKLPR